MLAVLGTCSLELPLHRRARQDKHFVFILSLCNHRKQMIYHFYWVVATISLYSSVHHCHRGVCVCVRMFFFLFFFHQHTNLIDRSRSIPGNKRQFPLSLHCNWDEADPFCCCTGPLLHSGPSNDPTQADQGWHSCRKSYFVGPLTCLHKP